MAEAASWVDVLYAFFFVGGVLVWLIAAALGAIFDWTPDD